MKRFLLLSLMFSMLMALGCQNKPTTQEPSSPNADSLLTKARTLFQILPAEAPNPENPLTPEKIALGKALYFDNQLSLNNTQSCNTCHNLDTYGVDNKATSPGDNGENGTRNSPTTLNAALHFVQFWDGRMKDVEEQAGGPVMNPAEMRMPDEKTVMARLRKSETYPALFAAAFPAEKDPFTFRNMTYAIAAFERTLLTPSKFDAFLGGDLAALNPEELTGLEEFINTGCIACHSGSLLGANMFQKYPLYGTHQEYTGSTVEDLGKMQATKLEADRYMFKVPSLRNIAETWPYFHDGSVKELEKTVDIMGRAELGKTLTPEQVTSIVTFMKTLTGEVPATAKKSS